MRTELRGRKAPDGLQGGDLLFAAMGLDRAKQVVEQGVEQVVQITRVGLGRP